MAQNQQTDWREFCKEILQLLDYYIPQDNRPTCWDPWRERVRLALAQPEPEVVGPSLSQVSDWITKCSQNPEDNRWTRHVDHHDALAIAKAALYDWGRPAPVLAGEVGELVRQLGSMAADAEAADWVCDAAVLDLAIKHLEQLNPSQPLPPAEGEVADLAEFLRTYGDHVLDEYGDLGEHDQLTRAADLLEQLQAAPMPVRERLPGPEDCDAEGRCWWGEPQIEDSHDATWNFCTQNDAEEFLTWGTKCGWLPAHALPLPSREVEHG